MQSGKTTPLQEEVAAQISAGLSDTISVCVMKDGHPVVDEIFGDDCNNRRPLFSAFSMSKPLTAAVLWRLKDRGLLNWDDPVAKFWPEFAKTHKNKGEVTIQNVLTHQAGMPSADFIPLKEYADWQAVIGHMERAPLEYPAGERTEYHSITFGWLAGEVVQRITGRPFEIAFKEEVAEPLGLSSTKFSLPPTELARVMPVLSGQTFEMPDISARFELILKEKVILPAASATSTPSDIAVFYSAVVCARESEAKGWLSQKVLEEATSPRVMGKKQNGAPYAMSLGMEIAVSVPNSFAAKIPYRTFGHGGIGSCVGFGNPDNGVSAAIFNTRLQDSHTNRFRLARLAEACVETATNGQKG